MSFDLFNNNQDSGNYVNPGLSPCAGTGEDKNAEFIDKGFGIVSGSEIFAKLDLDHISIPVNSWVQRTQILQPQEVTFIQGLDKGLIFKTQGYTMPNLVSVDEVLDSLFLSVDISVNYYAGFSFTYMNIDASGNYVLNIPVDTATTSAFSEAEVKASMTYDPSILNFQSTLAGYEFNITNVILTVTDASQDINSPFPTIIVNGERVPQVYTLVEDGSVAVPSSKYPTTAFQGIFMTAKPPTDSTISNFDKWIYINHAPALVTTYTPLTINFDSSVNAVSVIAYDASTIIGVKPVIIDDVSIVDVSANYDVSIAEILTPDVSNAIIDSSTLTNLYVLDSSITNSIIDSSVYSDSLIIDSSLINTVHLLRTDVSAGSIGGMNNLALGTSASYNSFDNVVMEGIVGIDFQYYNVGNLVLSASTYSVDAQDSFVYNISGDASVRVADSSLVNVSANITAYNSIILDSSISKLVSDQSSIYRVSLGNEGGTTTINTSKIWDSSIYDNVKIQDTSIFTSLVTALIDQSYVSDASLANSTITQSSIVQSSIWDSSLAINTVINQDTSISNSSLNNVWSNVFIFVSNPSTGEKIYVMEDDSLDIDSSAWRVNIYNSTIWDSSLNNTTIYDSSIYSSYFQDSSLVRCTVYNSIFDESTEVDTKTIMIDASISCDASIIQDSSIFYHKQTRQLDIGMNGASTETHMSAGDYLTHVEENNLWKKTADIYAWTTSVDPVTFTPSNLINGFYVYNPHDFQYQIDYIVFV